MSAQVLSGIITLVIFTVPIAIISWLDQQARTVKRGD
jgi:hypothetical protein